MAQPLDPSSERSNRFAAQPAHDHPTPRRRPTAFRLPRAAILPALLLSALFTARATAQNDPAPTRDEIQAARAALPEEKDESLTAADAAYQEALDAIARRETARQAEQGFWDQVAQVPARLEAIRRELAQPIEFAPPEVSPEDTTERIASQLNLARTDVEATKAQAAELEAEAARREQRRAEIPKEISAAKQRLQEVADSIDALPASPEAPREAARRAALLTTRDALQAEIAKLEGELAGIEARRELLPARRDQAKRRVEIAERRLKAWQTIMDQRQAREQEAAEREASRLRREAARRHPVLQTFAEENEALTKQAGEVTTSIESVTARKGEVEGQTADLRRRYRNVEQRLDLSGLDRATGLFLRTQYERLRRRNELERLIHDTQQQFSEVGLRKLEREEERDELPDTPAEIADDLIAAAKATPPAIAEEEVADIALELARNRRGDLTTLITRYGTLEDELRDLLILQRKWLQTTDKFRSFIEERILWTRSVEGGFLPNLRSASNAAVWLFASPDWIPGLKRAGRAMIARPAPWLLGLILLLGALAVHAPALRRLDRFGDNVSRYKTDSFVYTLRAAYLTLIAAAPWPATLLLLGLALQAPADQVEVARVAGVALVHASLTFYVVQLLRYGLRPKGLGDAHFRWPEDSIRLVRRHLVWFAPLLIPLVLIVSAMEAAGNTEWNDSLGRLAYLALMGAVLVFARFVLSPKGAVLRNYLGADEGGWGNRLRFVWFPAVLGIPLALALASLMGYHYTAVQFERKIEYTLLLLLIVIALNAILMRWLFIARRRLAIEDAKRRREAAVEKEGKEEQAQGEAPPIDENKLDLPAISLATRKLFRSAAVAGLVIGLVLVWGDTLPALRALDRVQLWPTITILEDAPADQAPERTADQAAAAPREQPGASLDLSAGGLPTTANQTADQPADQTGDDQSDAGLPQSLTLADLGLAIVILIATVVAFRNFPALIEIILLRRLPLDASARYALSAVLRYTIAIIGIALAFSALGLSWSKVQWLAAALTFGLAFGLQEIFANFVSGLIILAERPVRIGDTVTVGEISGTVSKIRMRATTITDWDRKELIIPNKTFITERVINWTLSDPVLRLTIPVGVSYGADVKLVERTLLRVADQNPTVLRDPAPYVLFKAFGDSTLDFELRAFIPHIDHIIAVRHGLHMAITAAFREADIEIAFPQRDLHIRSIGDFDKLVANRSDTDERLEA